MDTLPPKFSVGGAVKSNVSPPRKNMQVSSVATVSSHKSSFFQNVISLLTACCSAVWQTAYSRPFIKVTTKGGTSDWLYDSGASVTCMSLKQFRLIPPEFRGEKLPTNTKLVTADGNDLDVLGVYNIHLTVSNRSLWSPVFVCKKLHSAAILGIDCISKLGIGHSGRKDVFFFDDILDTPNAKSFIFQENKKSFENFATNISTISTIKIPPLCHATVCVNTVNSVGYSPPPGTFGISHISNNEFPTVTSNSGLVQINKDGNVYLQIFNTDTVAVEIPRNVTLGQLEIVDKSRLQNVDRNLYLASIDKASNRKQLSSPPPSTVERDFILKNIQISVPEKERKNILTYLKPTLMFSVRRFRLC